MWKVTRNGVVMAWGPEATLPSKEQRFCLRESGHEIWLDGKAVR